LVVQATDEQGHHLNQMDGPTVPVWGGNYAGQPGQGYAKILEELWTEISPSGAYWNPTRILSDNRIAAFATDTGQYAFIAPEQGSATIEVKLIFRRAFQELMDQKGWNMPDILMETQVITITP
jgi:hypothetical protein